MASVKIATLIIRTVAKPISSQLKNQAKQHETFKQFCVGLAQRMYRTEVRLRTGLLGEQAKHIRPLSETRAIENGANALAEGFLFTVAAALILGETYRSSRNQSKRRDDVDDQLESLTSQVAELNTRLEAMDRTWQTKLDEETRRNEQLAQVLGRVVEIGLHTGWAEFQDSPLQLPRILFNPNHRHHGQEELVQAPVETSPIDSPSSPDASQSSHSV